MSCAWTDCKKAFDNVPYEWMLRSLELFKVSPRVVGFQKHNMKNWKIKLILTHESGTLMSDNIFQGDSLSPLLFCISLIPLSLELNSSGYGYKIGTEWITHLLYMDDLNLYAKNDSELFFLYIQFTLFRTKSYSHQVLIYLSVPGIPVRGPLQNRQIVEEQLDV